MVRALAASLTLVIAACPAAAQAPATLTGKVLEEGSERAISTATVIATDAEGRRLSATFTDADGGWTLRVPAEGVVFLLAERLGYAPGEFGPLAVREAGAEPFLLRLAPRPLRLAEVRAGGEGTCDVDPGEGAASYDLWSQARTSLRAAVVTGEEGLVGFRARMWDRIVFAGGRTARVLHEQLIEADGPPFIAVEPDELAREGYIRVEGDTVVFFAPDAEVLLSDSFAATHCFRVVRGGILRNRGLVGLAFEPAPARTLPGVSGTLWMDGGSGELLRIEFDYVRLDPRLESGGGGRIEFLALEEGPLIVESWWIRWPLASSGGISSRGSPRRFHESGGEVEEVLRVGRR